MVEKLKEFSALSASTNVVENPQINELRIAIAKLQDEIDSWVAQIPNAVPAVMKLINEKVEKLDAEKQELEKKLRDLTAAQSSSGCNVDEITDYMSKWDELEVPDKMAVVDVLISVIRATQDTLEIEWKI